MNAATETTAQRVARTAPPLSVRALAVIVFGLAAIPIGAKVGLRMSTPNGPAAFFVLGSVVALFLLPVLLLALAWFAASAWRRHPSAVTGGDVLWYAASFGMGIWGWWLSNGVGLP
jgi:hypothetical protein